MNFNRHKLRDLRDDVRDYFGRLFLDEKLDRISTPLAPRNIVFVRWDAKLGDSIISSFVFRELKQAYPEIKLALIVGEGLEYYFSDSPYIDKLYSVKKRPSYSQIKKLAQQIFADGFDASVMLAEYIRPRDMYLLKHLACNVNIGADPSLGRFNLVLPEQELNKHFSTRFAWVLKSFNIETPCTDYIVKREPEAKARVEKLTAELKDRTIVTLNPYGSASHRKLTPQRIKEVSVLISTEMPEATIYLLYPPDKKSEVDTICRQLNNPHITYFNAAKSLYDSIELIAHSQLLCSVDTATVHIGTGLKIPTIGLYSDDSEIPSQWLPNNPSSVVIRCRRPGEKGEEINLGEFDDDKLIFAIRELMPPGSTESTSLEQENA